MLTSGFEWSVARRYLLKPPSDGYISLNTILSVVAIALGVAALISVMSVMNGFRAGLMDSILGHQGHAVIYGYNAKISDYQRIEKGVETLSGVKMVRPYLEAQVMLTNHGRAYGAVVRGLPDKHLTQENMNGVTVVDGSLDVLKAEGGLVLGYRLARKLGVVVGDSVTIVSPNTVSTPFGSTLRYLAFPVQAVVDIGLYQFDESFVGMPLDQAQIFFRYDENQLSNIELFLDDPEMIDTVLPEVMRVVNGEAVVQGWRSYNPALIGALQTERVAMFMILSLIILVAVFNISSSLVMLVKDKSGDIAILRTMGATRASIRRIFLIVGLGVGFSGIAAGGLLASLFVSNIVEIKEFLEWAFNINVWDPSTRWISEIRAEVDWLEVWLTVGVAAVMSFLATIIPAIRASRLDPVAVLRHE